MLSPAVVRRNLLQAAGRANREGLLGQPGRVIIVDPCDAGQPPSYRTLVGLTRVHFGPGKADPDDLEALRLFDTTVRLPLTRCNRVFACRPKMFGEENMNDRMVSRCASAIAKVNWRTACFAFALVGIIGFSPASRAADGGNWIGSWASSPQPAWGADFPAPLGMPANLWKQTIRQTARLSIGGSRVRIVLSNEYGKTPLTIGAAEIALAGEAGKIKEGSAHAVTFGGNPTIVVPPGAPAISDPIDMSVDPLALVSVSLYLPEVTPLSTIHWDGHQTAYVGTGNQVANVDFKADSKMTQRVFLSEILVDAPAGARAVVAFGDSITDGDGSTVDGNDRWPDRLAERLAKVGGPPVVLYWLRDAGKAVTTRANIILFFAITGVITAISYLASGLLSYAILGLAVAIGLFEVRHHETVVAARTIDAAERRPSDGRGPCRIWGEYPEVGRSGGDHADIESGMDCGQRITIAGNDRHLGAMRKQRFEQSETEASASTGNDDFLVFQVHRVCSIV